MSDTIIMPQLGETVAEGKILTWFKAVGDDVKPGDKLFEVETDKVTVEVEAIAAGKLTEIKVGAGEVSNVGAVVAVLGGSGASPARLERPKPVAAASLSAFEEVRTSPGNFGKAKGPNDVRITPLARRAISQRGLDLAEIFANAQVRGLRKIEERDISSLTVAPAAKTALQSVDRDQPRSAGEVITLNAIRSRTAQRLTENWRNIPHVFQAIDVDFSAVEEVRSRHKERFKRESGISLTYLPFIARACTIALQSFPLVNARFESNALKLSQDINIGIAVDLNHNGLVVPVVHAAQDYTLQGLAKAIGKQIDKARTNKLTPSDHAGGTYSITNNGAFGTSFTSPIINAPQVAILSSDAIRKKPAVISTAEGDFVGVRLMGTIGQSFDHRAFDGAYSASFLSKLKDILENKKWAGELGEEA